MAGAFAKTEHQIDRAAHQRRKNVWPHWERRLGTEEWHPTRTRLPVNGRTIAGNRQPLSTLDPVFQFYGGLRTDFGNLDCVVLDIRPQGSDETVVKSGVLRMYEHVDAALEVCCEACTAKFGIAEVRYD